MKKLLAIAIAALPVSALADVTLYGKVGMEVGYHKDGSFALKPNGDKNAGVRFDDTTSRIGFKGSEDLGNGLKAIWQIEQSVRLEQGQGGNAFATRDSFVGLAGDWGKVRLGRLSTYQNSDMAMVDPWMYGKGVNGLGIFTRFDDRVNNAVRYDSPDMSGFNFSVLYGVDETRNYGAEGRKNEALINLGLGYSNAGFFAAYSFLQQNDTANGKQKDRSHRLEAGYETDDLLVALGFQHTKGFNVFGAYDGAPVVTGNKGSTSKELALTVGTSVGAFAPRLSLVKGWDLKVGDNKAEDSGYFQFVVGSDYSLSKRTTAYASFGQVKWDGDGNNLTDRTFGVGVEHKF